MTSFAEITSKEAKQVMDELGETMTLEAMIEACTPHGKGKGIKTNKPADGIMAYVWRMARFNNGDDPTMPVTAYWDLADGLSKRLGHRISTAMINDDLKVICRFLEGKSDELITATGGNRFSAAIHWGRALGYIQ